MPAIEPHPVLPPGRPFEGMADLRAMEACLAASWNLRRPFVNTTPGDLEWWIASATPGTDWRRLVHVWTVGDEVVAYGWLSPPASLDWHQRADLPAGVRAGIVDETLAWAASTAHELAVIDGTAAPPVLEAWAMDSDAQLRGLLTDRGWTPAAEPSYTHWYRRLDGAPPDAVPGLPDGYRVRHVRLPDDFEARVDVHRAAFAPSRMTVGKYEALAAMPLYAPERDLVVEAPDGSLAAFVLTWWSPDAGVGEFEPVGTHPDHQRRGLGRAINLAGLWLLRDLGATDAIVFSRTTNTASQALYAAVGFEAVTQHRSWTRSLG